MADFESPNEHYDYELEEREAQLEVKQQLDAKFDDFEARMDQEMNLSEYAESGKTEWNDVFKSHRDARMSIAKQMYADKYNGREYLRAPELTNLERELDVLEKAFLAEKVYVYQPLLTGREEIEPLGGGVVVRRIINEGYTQLTDKSSNESTVKKLEDYQAYLERKMEEQIQNWKVGERKGEKGTIEYGLDKLLGSKD